MGLFKHRARRAARFVATLLLGIVPTVAVAQESGLQGLGEQRQTSAAPRWIEDSHGCKVWNPAPKEDETVDWSGECQNGYASGWGAEQWYRSGVPGNRIVGRRSGDEFIGIVSISYPGGAKYYGHLVGNKFEEWGELTYMDGAIYRGGWLDGKKNGHGELIKADGFHYVGEFNGGAFQGFGSLWLPDGGRYDGYFYGGKPNGRGVYASSGGQQYVGIFRDGHLVELTPERKRAGDDATKQNACGVVRFLTFLAAMGAAPTTHAGVAAAQGLDAAVNAPCD